jgi:amino acid transporter
VANGLALALAFYWPPLAEGLWRWAIVTVLTLALTAINIVGVKQSSWVVNVLTIGKLVPLAMFIAAGIWFVDPSHWAVMPAVTPEQAGQAALLLIFAYGGYEVTGVLAGEAANPKRDVPFAFVMTLASITATGLLPNLAETRTPIADGAALLLGAAGAFIVSLGSSLSMAGNNMGQILNGSRTIFALAENGDLPQWFARVHPGYRTPANAILFTAGVALLLALSGSFVFLAAVSAVARLVMYLAVCLATLVLRRRQPTAEMGPALFVIPGGPVIPLLAAVVSFGILFGATTQQLAAGAAALVAGAVLFWIATRK